jgi:hypothetical protein
MRQRRERQQQKKPYIRPGDASRIEVDGPAVAVRTWTEPFAAMSSFFSFGQRPSLSRSLSRYLFTTANSPESTRRVYRFEVYLRQNQMQHHTGGDMYVHNVNMVWITSLRAQDGTAMGWGRVRCCVYGSGAVRSARLKRLVVAQDLRR